MPFTTERAREMLEHYQEKEPEKFFAAVYTIARDGVTTRDAAGNEVSLTPAEVPAHVAILATEVRSRALEARVKVAEEGLALTASRLDKLARNYVAFKKSLQDPAPAAAEVASPPTVAGASASAGDDIEARMDRAISRGQVPDDVVVGTHVSGPPPAPPAGAPAMPPAAAAYQDEAAALLQRRGVAGAFAPPAPPPSSAPPPAPAPTPEVATVVPPPARADGKSAHVPAKA